MSTLRSGAERDDGTDARSDAVPGRDGTLTGREDPHLDPTTDPGPAVVDADELLLDALGRGGPVPGDDPLAGALAAWRAELDADLPALGLDDLPALDLDDLPALGPADLPALDLDDLPALGPADLPALGADGAPRRLGARPGGLRPPRPAVPARRPRPGVAAGRRHSGRPGAGPPGSARDGSGPAGSRPPLRPGRLLRRLVLSGVVGVVVTALLGLGVNHAGPASPLWPVAAAVYPDRSAVRAAEHTIQLAREALAEQRYAQARAELDRAAVQVTEIRDPAEAGRLRTEIERVRLGLPGVADRSEAPAGEPSTPDRPAPTTPAPGRTPAPARTPGGAAPPTVRSGPAQPPPASPSDRQVLPLPLPPVLPSLLPSGLPLLPSGCVLLCPPDD
ncbi:hypothetical protein [Plantactinospora sp. BB1]|uniref:hypothetical protein n=1 Tax=Plantactinospora sp. BB1 TaxID=2071627 RepID=UPI00131F1C0C|nr:hypothetical protein [Plantactinospora sp. BB1]